MFWRRKKKSFFDHFESHARETQAAARMLKELFGGSGLAKELAKGIKNREHVADQITHEVVNQLNVGFIHPLDSEDILQFIKTLDEVMDDIYHAAEAFAEIFELSEGTQYALQFSDVVLRAVGEIVAICSLLRSPSRNLAHITKCCVEVHKLEHEADDLRKKALHLLFSELKDQHIDVPAYVAWNDIYCMLENITDKAEDCANLAEQMSMKYS